jgi:hypothetical protein
MDAINPNLDFTGQPTSTSQARPGSLVGIVAPPLSVSNDSISARAETTQESEMSKEAVERYRKLARMCGIVPIAMKMKKEGWPVKQAALILATNLPLGI